MFRYMITLDVMQIVKHTEIRKVTLARSATVWEYDTDDATISGAVAEINGRYPEKGFAENGFKELVFVISGNGIIVTPTKRIDIDLGDEILLDKKEKYAWEGNVTLFMATTPKFNPRQHKITEK
jgi:mannose-6-phosphate isomerase class I